MGHMNILFPKLLIQALTKAPQRKLARAKQTRRHVPSPRRSRTREDQRPLLPRALIALIRLTQRVLLERQNRSFGKSERADHVRVRHTLDLLICDLEERLPHGVARVPYSYADLCAEFLLYRGERGVEFGWVVFFYGEGSCLASGGVDLVCGFGEVLWVAGYESYFVAVLCKEAAMGSVMIVCVGLHMGDLRRRGSDASSVTDTCDDEDWFRHGELFAG